eukprot:CAMPEP_0183300278 /NCGR_PEP_ID=MMETSP0160_2-20130417/6757_1 /TAXON_ID=2839 ORGANISM="Odontella Sinensis, Strain Grunow 1884" /NCGR_SAMPLE_ID=MMETSP0160_2 /ASSEMBLY_ACC=CAM_ASM_000250 /LENGTH=276 /DNA_ID=CAMNT_0025462665 /DNA_START=68 /DNA_END=898 /DNA_ORIENTATION=-
MSDESSGKEVAGGKHVVPEGVAVEELDGGKKKLSEECPEDLLSLLEKKGAKDIYDKLVEEIVKEGNTRSMFGQWNNKEFESIIDFFREDFADKGIKVALCSRSAKSLRWLEFIDYEALPDYIPMYDVANRSGQVINTVYHRLKFPNGVAVEELKSWGGKKKLKEKIPIYVEKMLTKKGLMEEYDALVDACIEQGVGKRFKSWNLEKLKIVVGAHRPIFEDKGVALFLSQKEEWVSHGQHGGHMEHFRWIEFVDRELQPDYYPQRDATTRTDNCIIS